MEVTSKHRPLFWCWGPRRIQFEVHWSLGILRGLGEATTFQCCLASVATRFYDLTRPHELKSQTTRSTDSTTTSAHCMHDACSDDTTKQKKGTDKKQGEMGNGRKRGYPGTGGRKRM